MRDQRLSPKVVVQVVCSLCAFSTICGVFGAFAGDGKAAPSYVSHPVALVFIGMASLAVTAVAGWRIARTVETTSSPARLQVQCAVLFVIAGLLEVLASRTISEGHLYASNADSLWYFLGCIAAMATATLGLRAVWPCILGGICVELVALGCNGADLDHIDGGVFLVRLLFYVLDAGTGLAMHSAPSRPFGHGPMVALIYRCSQSFVVFGSLLSTATGIVDHRPLLVVLVVTFVMASFAVPIASSKVMGRYFPWGGFLVDIGLAIGVNVVLASLILRRSTVLFNEDAQVFWFYFVGTGAFWMAIHGRRAALPLLAAATALQLAMAFTNHAPFTREAALDIVLQMLWFTSGIVAGGLAGRAVGRALVSREGEGLSERLLGWYEAWIRRHKNTITSAKPI